MSKNIKIGDKTYNGVEYISCACADEEGVQRLFIDEDDVPAQQEKSVALSMASGNQVVTADAGKVLSKVTVQKPETLLPANIRKDVSVGGVLGTLEEKKEEQAKTVTVTENKTTEVTPDSGNVLSKVTVVTNIPATPTEEKSVALSMASGDQVVTPTSGKNLSKVTVEKPTTLIAANIKKGVNIGGVVGTLEASSSSIDVTKLIDRTITELTFPTGITEIGDYALAGCYSLTLSAYLPETITTIGVYAFMGCKWAWGENGQSEIHIPDSVTTIGESAFLSSIGLRQKGTKATYIEIGSGIQNIGTYAFGVPDADSVTREYHIKATTPPTIGSDIFGLLDSVSMIAVPSGCLEAYQSATNWSGYADKMIEE